MSATLKAEIGQSTAEPSAGTGTILVPVEGATVSEHAMPLAVELAAKTHSRLILLRVVQPVVTTVGPYLTQMERAAVDALAKQAARVRLLYHLEPASLCRVGSPPDVIVEEAARGVSWCIVLASSSRQGLLRTRLGSVAERVVDMAPLPVFVIPIGAHGPDGRPVKRILVPLDGSRRAGQIMPVVDELALRLDADVVRLHVISREPALQEAERFTLESKGQSLRAPAMDLVETGDPAEAIAATCRQLEVGLIAFATHGRSAISTERLSNRAEALLRHSTVPLMAFGREALHQLDIGTVPRIPP